MKGNFASGSFYHLLKKTMNKAPHDSFRDILIQRMHTPTDSQKEICNHLQFKFQDKVKKNLKKN